VSRPVHPVTARLVDDDFFAGDPYPDLARLRHEAPVAWDPDLGYWALTRHADVLAVSRDSATFCSRQGVLYAALKPADQVPAVPGSLLTADPPQHTWYRKILQPSFTPSRMRALEPHLRTLAGRLLDAVEPGAVTELVDAVAVPFPLVVLAELMGLPTEEWPRFRVWVDHAVAAGGRPAGRRPPEVEASMAEMSAYLLGAVDERRGRTDDPGVVATLANLEVDGRALTEPELLLFVVQLFIAGNETTRNLIAGGIAALAEHPAQWARLVADPSLVPPAVEEMLRWTSPVVNFFRTATRDVEVGGQTIRAGEPICMSYTSANVDELEFGPTADRFDVGRTPNNHLAFGFGTHFCIGAMLARIEARVLLEELLARHRTLEPAGPVVRNPSHLIAGFRSVPVTFG